MRHLPLLLLAGCPRPETCDPAAGAPSVTIGVGEDAFAAVDEGGEISPVRGSQGGAHLPIALAGAHLPAGDLDTFLTATLAGEEIANLARQLRYRCNADEARQEVTDLPLVLGYLEPLQDQLIDVDVRVDLPDGASVAAIHSFTVNIPWLEPAPSSP